MAETRITSVTCNHCGAPLPIRPETRFLTCTYCGARLEVHRTGGALYTQVLESIDQRTQRIEQDVEAIRRQNEVERLDREWQMRREQLMVRGEDGGASIPSAVGGLVGGLIAAAFGIFFAVTASRDGAPAIFPIFGVVFVLVGIGGAIASVGKAAQYRDAEQRYRRQRARLMRDAVAPSRDP
jgi:hypothetical protein